MEITPQDLAALLQSPTPPLLIDVREPWEIALAPMPNALPIPLRHLPAHIHSLDATKDTVIVCHHGVRSMHAALMLKGAGFTSVRSLAGGTERWSLTVDPSLRRY